LNVAAQTLIFVNIQFMKQKYDTNGMAIVPFFSKAYQTGRNESRYRKIKKSSRNDFMRIGFRRSGYI